MLTNTNKEVNLIITLLACTNCTWKFTNIIFIYFHPLLQIVLTKQLRKNEIKCCLHIYLIVFLISCANSTKIKIIHLVKFYTIMILHLFYSTGDHI